MMIYKKFYEIVAAAAIKAALTTESQSAQPIVELVGLSEPIIKEDGLNDKGKACKMYRLEQ